MPLLHCQHNQQCWSAAPHLILGLTWCNVWCRLCGQAMLALLDPTGKLLGARIMAEEDLGAGLARAFTQVRNMWW